MLLIREMVARESLWRRLIVFGGEWWSCHSSQVNWPAAKRREEQREIMRQRSSSSSRSSTEVAAAAPAAHSVKQSKRKQTTFSNIRPHFTSFRTVLAGRGKAGKVWPKRAKLCSALACSTGLALLRCWPKSGVDGEQRAALAWHSCPTNCCHTQSLCVCEPLWLAGTTRPANEYRHRAAPLFLGSPP